MTEADLLAEEFERSRAHLRAVAYRMLGSAAEADDAVQEAWLRLARSDAEAVSNLRGWLTTVIGRVCLDMLRSRRARREDSYEGSPPEPVVAGEPPRGPAEEAELADSVGIAMLVVLETLTPPERLAFVLHDMFGVAFDEIAGIVDRSPEAARQLASRARRRVRGAAPSPDPDLAEQRRVVDPFLAAARAGDFEALVAVLDPDVVFRAHLTVRDVPELPPAVGAEVVARRVLARGANFAPLARPAIVNGSAGAVVESEGRRLSVLSFNVVGGRIAAIDVIAGREALAALRDERADPRARSGS
jgi:RNA polymerase sigma-70 factor (ECF subfamily)